MGRWMWIPWTKEYQVGIGIQVPKVAEHKLLRIYNTGCEHLSAFISIHYQIFPDATIDSVSMWVRYH